MADSLFAKAPSSTSLGYIDKACLACSSLGGGARILAVCTVFMSLYPIGERR